MPEVVYNEVALQCWTSADPSSHETSSTYSSPVATLTTAECNTIHFAPRLLFSELVHRLEVFCLQWPAACDQWGAVHCEAPVIEVCGHDAVITEAMYDVTPIQGTFAATAIRSSSPCAVGPIANSVVPNGLKSADAKRACDEELCTPKCDSSSAAGSSSLYAIQILSNGIKPEDVATTNDAGGERPTTTANSTSSDDSVVFESHLV
jgi:hypothetical protein